VARSLLETFWETVGTCHEFHIISLRTDVYFLIVLGLEPERFCRCFIPYHLFTVSIGRLFWLCGDVKFSVPSLVPIEDI